MSSLTKYVQPRHDDLQWEVIFSVSEMAPTAEETLVSEVMSEEDVWEEAAEEVEKAESCGDLDLSLEAFAVDELGENEMVM